MMDGNINNCISLTCLLLITEHISANKSNLLSFIIINLIDNNNNVM